MYPDDIDPETDRFAMLRDRYGHLYGVDEEEEEELEEADDDLGIDPEELEWIREQQRRAKR